MFVLFGPPQPPGGSRNCRQNPSSCIPSNPPSSTHYNYKMIGFTNADNTLLMSSRDRYFCRNCTIFIGVEGVAETTSYRLSASTNAAVVELTTDGHMTTGSVAQGEYAYYSFTAKKTSRRCEYDGHLTPQLAPQKCPALCQQCDPSSHYYGWSSGASKSHCFCSSPPEIQIDVNTPSIGAVDVLIKKEWQGFTLPTIEEDDTYDRSGEAHMLIKSTDDDFCENCNYALAVLGKSNRTVNFNIQVSTDPQKILTLTPGVPFRGMFCFVLFCLFLLYIVIYILFIYCYLYIVIYIFLFLYIYIYIYS